MKDTHKESAPILEREITEGKTKIIYEHPLDASRVVVRSKDDITAGDGARRETIEGKAVLATETTSNVFTLLNKKGIPTSFIKRINATDFEALHCKMIPLEVVMRRQALGSYLKRNPNTQKGETFKRPLGELYLKTKDKKWNGKAIPKDDPLSLVENGSFVLFRPDQPLIKQKPFLSVPRSEVLPAKVSLLEIGIIAEKVFATLEEAWRTLGVELADMKIEFGITKEGKVVVSDVIDNDSWRLLQNGKHLDKQVFRDGTGGQEVKNLYELVAKLTSRFV
ncbi:phosphoribosylaminoimidazolesuccinocarboxamide synthase [Candidatus Kaiserbacteria bacterium CG10_big_fil_rev_8_21_14_0_10_45_20]|uniref:phosphoribosylaminoimidazolesuccinocarboxamide synthase n=1 Tax=Candidatus Kaiserbacteria bacterium CG10_big_fil_rev_8_21_14_0_10_45_20 TaxID=1974607 RepID=A0A2H0UFB6_9BACT|nr:MAG: phosphoribosylaminoimidazolesuccinocarboxamide synthase [Candidatus Kaiserbacteria bacterium CG10_big_fil_rev_8_21_14_0_10_45_20]